MLALRGHVETNDVTRSGMRGIGCGLDQLDLQKVKNVVQDVFHVSIVQVTVLTLPAVAGQADAEVDSKPETPTSAEKAHDDENR